MIGLVFDRPVSEVLCLGAHPDDIEIGALGLLGRLAERNPATQFSFVILTGSEGRRKEAEVSLEALFGGRGKLQIADFEDGSLPYRAPADAKAFLRAAIGDTQPQLVISPGADDLHQDHAFVAHLARQLLRDHLILEYEIAKFEGDLGNPQVFVPLTDDDLSAKVDHLARHFSSQHDKAWYDERAFRSLMRLRGIESNSPSGYAEAFHVSKLLLA